MHDVVYVRSSWISAEVETKMIGCDYTTAVSTCENRYFGVRHSHVVFAIIWEFIVNVTASRPEIVMNDRMLSVTAFRLQLSGHAAFLGIQGLIGQLLVLELLVAVAFFVLVSRSCDDISFHFQEKFQVLCEMKIRELYGAFY